MYLIKSKVSKTRKGRNFTVDLTSINWVIYIDIHMYM